MDSAPTGSAKRTPPANDALLAQLVRGTLGRNGRGTSRINVSTCSFVVTLHGSVDSVEERDEVGKLVSTVPGVEAVTNKPRVT
jgi:osmotically-inducible protein OsmY